jgi:glutathione S-transferase
MIVLHQFEISPFCDKVRRILHVKGEPYEVREVPPSRAVIDVRRINRIGKLPTIEDGSRLVADSTEIAYYLEERFPEPPLLPKHPLERALVHVLEDWADESLYFYEMTLRFGLPHNRRRWLPVLTKYDSAWFQRIAPFVMPMIFHRRVRTQGVGRKPTEAVVADVERHVRALDGLVGDGQWLVGSALTLADIAVFVQIFCIRGSDEGARVVAAYPRVAAWMDRVDAATQPHAQS